MYFKSIEEAKNRGWTVDNLQVGDRVKTKWYLDATFMGPYHLELNEVVEATITEIVPYSTKYLKYAVDIPSHYIGKVLIAETANSRLYVYVEINTEYIQEIWC